MEDFFSYDFQISNIDLCLRVLRGQGEPRHRDRRNHGLVFASSGTKTYAFLGGKAHTVEAGQVYYLPRFSDYDVSTVTDGDCIAVNFQLADPAVTFDFFAMPAALGEKYRHLFERLEELWNRQPVGYHNACNGILYTIVYEIQQDARLRYASPAQEALLQRTDIFLRQHLADPALSVAAIAAAADITPEYYRRLFRRRHGVSPCGYIQLLRISRAKALIGSGELRLKEVGRACGFESASYFCNEFRRHTGMSPSDYRRKNSCIVEKNVL